MRCDTNQCTNKAIWRVTLYYGKSSYYCDCHLETVVANERFRRYQQGFQANSGSVGGYTWERMAKGK